MPSKKQEENKKRIFKNGLFYHPTKKGVVLAISPYGLLGSKTQQPNNFDSIKNIKV
jgi:hypothetical protein